MHSWPQTIRARLQHVLADTGALVWDRACSITPVAGEAPAGGGSVVVGRRRGGVTNVVEAVHNSSARLRSARRRNAGCSSPGCAGFAAPGFAVLVNERSLPMVKAGEEVRRCAYRGCESEPRPGAAEQGYCGLRDPVTGEPHWGLTGSGGARCWPGKVGGRPGRGIRVGGGSRSGGAACGPRLTGGRRVPRRGRLRRGWARRWRRRLPPSRRR
jgi:hypothetical protein